MNMHPAHAEEPGSDAEQHALMDINQENAKKTGIDRDGRAARGSWLIPAAVSMLVALIFFGNLPDAGQTQALGAPEWSGLASLPEIAAAIVDDTWNVLRSHVRTFGLIGLYALIPGVLGSIYRKKFWPWFLSVFAVLFALNVPLPCGPVDLERW